MDDDDDGDDGGDSGDDGDNGDDGIQPTTGHYSYTFSLSPHTSPVRQVQLHHHLIEGESMP